MTLQHPLLKLLPPAIAFVLTALVIVAMNRSSSPPDTAGAGGAGSFAGAGRSTDERIRALEAAVRADPKSTSALVSLGNAFVQKARDTADAAYYARAELAFRRALDQSPRDAGALAGMGSLALARHDFESALRYGREAQRSAPGVVRVLGVIADAEVELGRYAAAERTLQRMVDLKPNLASYARVSYFRELHGDLTGAASAMRLAASAGGDAREDQVYVQALLGNLELARGRVGAARIAYRAALARYPGYAPAAAGLARVEASGGRLDQAIRRYRSVSARLPLPEYVIALAEAELAAGKEVAAERDLALVRVEQRLLERNGVNTDAELALFEANHGSPARAVTLARRAYAAAPSVRSEDALGWALTRAGRPAEGLRYGVRALRLGSRDALFLYHAGMSARAAGRSALARRYLERSLALNPRFSPLYAPRARRALEALS